MQNQIVFIIWVPRNEINRKLVRMDFSSWLFSIVIVVDLLFFIRRKKIGWILILFDLSLFSYTLSWVSKPITRQGLSLLIKPFMPGEYVENNTISDMMLVVLEVGILLQ
jgi:hypothetical protein